MKQLGEIENDFSSTVIIEREREREDVIQTEININAGNDDSLRESQRVLC